MQMLLDHNIDITIVDHEQGATPLHYVAHRPVECLQDIWLKVKMTMALVSNAENEDQYINQPDQDGNTLLHIATQMYCMFHLRISYYDIIIRDIILISTSHTPVETLDSKDPRVQLDQSYLHFLLLDYPDKIDFTIQNGLGKVAMWIPRKRSSCFLSQCHDRDSSNSFYVDPRILIDRDAFTLKMLRHAYLNSVSTYVKE